MIDVTGRTQVSIVYIEVVYLRFLNALANVTRKGNTSQVVPLSSTDVLFTVCHPSSYSMLDMRGGVVSIGTTVAPLLLWLP